MSYRNKFLFSISKMPDMLDQSKAESARILVGHFQNYMHDISKYGFYASLGDTVYSRGSNVYCSGLCQYILKKRPHIVQGYFEYLNAIEI